MERSVCITDPRDNDAPCWGGQMMRACAMSKRLQQSPTCQVLQPGAAWKDEPEDNVFPSRIVSRLWVMTSCADERGAWRTGPQPRAAELAAAAAAGGAARAGAAASFAAAAAGLAAAIGTAAAADAGMSAGAGPPGAAPASASLNPVGALMVYVGPGPLSPPPSIAPRWPGGSAAAPNPTVARPRASPPPASPAAAAEACTTAASPGTHVGPGLASFSAPTTPGCAAAAPARGSGLVCPGSRRQLLMYRSPVAARRRSTASAGLGLTSGLGLMPDAGSASSERAAWAPCRAGARLRSCSGTTAMPCGTSPQITTLHT